MSSESDLSPSAEREGSQAHRPPTQSIPHGFFALSLETLCSLRSNRLRIQIPVVGPESQVFPEVQHHEMGKTLRGTAVDSEIMSGGLEA